jgi:hypothetical protein
MMEKACVFRANADGSHTVHQVLADLMPLIIGPWSHVCDEAVVAPQTPVRTGYLAL